MGMASLEQIDPDPDPNPNHIPNPNQVDAASLEVAMEAAARAASELRGSTTLREARATILLTTNIPAYLNRR